MNNDLIITEILCNGKPVDYEKQQVYKPVGRSISQKIEIKNGERIQELIIKYHGTVNFSFEKRSNWHNIITRDIKTLSWYSVWYPQETSVEINHDKVIIINNQDLFVVKGIFDGTRNVWEYGNRGYDPYNIIAYRKEALKTISNQHMNIYFADDAIKEQAGQSVAVYREIIDYFNGNLFKKINIPVLDVACVSPAITIGGGYRREYLMWCTSLGNSDQEIAWLNAHETAHIWCEGADYGTWEDWLNETTAEWASLLFALQKTMMLYSIL